MITVERASELVKNCKDRNDKTDLFDHFYGLFDPSFSCEFGEMFAQLCGFAVARNITIIKDE